MHGGAERTLDGRISFAKADTVVLKSKFALQLRPKRDMMSHVVRGSDPCLVASGHTFQVLVSHFSGQCQVLSMKAPPKTAVVL
jgi:hypothetical protein